MSTLGRGSNAQKVRDEVLNIMHRHNIKEVSGHFMEEWHQKLHNNTTPDDLVICGAYLEFLRSNGNLFRFYQKLEEGGVTKERLESFERPIRSNPDFVPYLKDALIHDFEHFLGILKEVHAGADLGISIQAARRLFDGEMHGLMDFIWSHQNDRDVGPLLRKITQSRQLLANRFGGPSCDVRDILFLDIALEDFLRIVIERSFGQQLTGEQLVDWIDLILQNLSLSGKDIELQHSLAHWKRLEGLPHFQREWSLHSESVLERIRRAIGSLIDRFQNLIQPKAEFLGSAFHADSWTINLFSEEVLRGRPAFVLSTLLRYLDPVLRKSADLGNWQVISRGQGTGELETVDSLKSVQGRHFERTVVIVATKISGDEEIPHGVAAIITPSDIDALSHLAIRARNAGVLFAVCYDPDTIAELKALNGRLIKLEVDSAGSVIFEESSSAQEIEQKHPIGFKAALPPAGFSAYAVSMTDFTEKNVGYKSNKLWKLRGKLPDWIVLPASVALPFGVFEKTLAEKNNAGVAKKHDELIGQVEKVAEDKKSEVLSDIRETIMRLNAPDELITALRRAMAGEGLEWPPDWNDAWTCIKKVWASKWNERACLSREANGIPHNTLLMSVLIQKVVESEYGFVIHTVNPFTGTKDEVYAEVVLGTRRDACRQLPGKGAQLCLQ